MLCLCRRIGAQAWKYGAWARGGNLNGGLGVGMRGACGVALFARIEGWRRIGALGLLAYFR